MWHDSTFDSRDKPLFSVIKQVADGINIFGTKIDFRRNLRMGISALLERADLADKFQGTVLAPGQVLDQAHNEAIFLGYLDYNRRDFGLPERDECFQAPLTADEVVATVVLVLAHRYRLF